MIDMSDDARTYYADGFRRTIGGVPCKVFSRRTADGRYIRPKGSPFYDPAFDHPKTGVSRTTVAAPEVVQEIERKEAMEAIAALARSTAEPRDNVVHVDFAAGCAVEAVASESVLAPMPNYEACTAVAAFAVATAAMPEILPVEREEAPEVCREPEAPEIAPTGLLAGVMAVQADMRARLAALEARLAPPSVENETPAAEAESSPLPTDPRARALRDAGRLTYMSTPRRSPARERLLRRYLAMRAEREEAADASRRAIRERDKRRAAVMRSGQWREKYLAAQLRAIGWETRAGQAEARMYADEKRRRAIGHVVKLRQRRAMDRMALHAAGETVRELNERCAKLDRWEAAAARYGEPDRTGFGAEDNLQFGAVALGVRENGEEVLNPPAGFPGIVIPNAKIGFVARLHAEREARESAEATARAKISEMEAANEKLADHVLELCGRALRAEARARVLEASRTPVDFAHVGSPSARVSFQLPVAANGRVQ